MTLISGCLVLLKHVLMFVLPEPYQHSVAAGSFLVTVAICLIMALKPVSISALAGVCCGLPWGFLAVSFIVAIVQEPLAMSAFQAHIVLLYPFAFFVFALPFWLVARWKCLKTDRRLIASIAV